MERNIKSAYSRLRETNIISNFFNLSGIQISNTLLMILTIPIVTRNIGIAAFGVVMFASRFSQFAGLVINWGTGQSAVKDVTFNLTDNQSLRRVVFTTVSIRIIIFLLFILLLFLLQWLNVYQYSFLLFAVPMVMAEVFNPISFFIGAERLKIFNVCNLMFNFACVLALVIFIRSPADAIWVNFILGTANIVTYLMLLVYFCAHFKLPFYIPSRQQLLKAGKENFYLAINNLSVNLQQSIIIFALPRWGYTMLLGPYTLCDRIVGQLRNVLITISNAIYPNAARYFQQSEHHWNHYRRKIKYTIAAVFLTGSVITFFMADLIVFVLSKEHNATAVMFLKIMAFVPAISALNVFNVLDQLLKNNNVYIFRIAMVLLGVACIVAVMALNIGNKFLVGCFTPIVEISAWLLYEYIIRKNIISNV